MRYRTRGHVDLNTKEISFRDLQPVCEAISNGVDCGMIVHLIAYSVVIQPRETYGRGNFTDSLEIAFAECGF